MPKRTKPIMRKAPPIDWLWAAVLERKQVYNLDLRQMAEIAGVSYEQMRRYIRRSPWEWPRHMRDNVCDAFRIRAEFTANCVKLEE